VKNALTREQPVSYAILSWEFTDSVAAATVNDEEDTAENGEENDEEDDEEDGNFESEESEDSEDEEQDDFSSDEESDYDIIDGDHDGIRRKRLSRYTAGKGVPCATHSRQYRGHCNVETTKDVNFYGPEDDYVVSGSDCGNLFIWERKSGRLLNILQGDCEVVNVIQR
jgi:nuclear receptor interaction protein